MSLKFTSSQNEVCVYEYTAKDEETTAKSVKVNFSKDCNTQKVSICEDQYGYHTSYGGGYCKEVHQTTCFNTPKYFPINCDLENDLAQKKY